MWLSATTVWDCCRYRHCIAHCRTLHEKLNQTHLSNARIVLAFCLSFPLLQKMLVNQLIKRKDLLCLRSKIQINDHWSEHIRKLVFRTLEILKITKLIKLINNRLWKKLESAQRYLNCAQANFFLLRI
jgi:hypothetical protein